MPWATFWCRAHLDPQFYKKIFGLLLLVVGLDMVTGVTETLRQRQAHRAIPVRARRDAPAPSLRPAANDHVGVLRQLTLPGCPFQTSTSVGDKKIVRHP